MRHFMERGKRDTDGVRHRTKVLWRAAAALQKEIEAERKKPQSVKDLIREYGIGSVGAVSDYCDKLHERPDFVIPWEPLT
jgi:hypothetical protein